MALEGGSAGVGDDGDVMGVGGFEDEGDLLCCFRIDNDIGMFVLERVVCGKIGIGMSFLFVLAEGDLVLVQVRDDFVDGIVVVAVERLGGFVQGQGGGMWEEEVGRVLADVEGGPGHSNEGSNHDEGGCSENGLEPVIWRLFGRGRRRR